MNKGILVAFCFLAVSLFITEAFRLEKRSEDQENIVKKVHAFGDKKFVAKHLKIENGLRLDLDPSVKFAKLESAVQEVHKKTEIQK